MITKQNIREDIANLGIREGDLLFITGGMKSIGAKSEIEGNLFDYFIPLLLDILGKSGTLVTYSYTNQYLLKNINEDDLFTVNTPSTSGGAIANIMLKHKNAVRSTHPTSSLVAIGKLAHEIVDDHTPTSSAYSVLGKLVEYNAKLIVFGCLDTNPGMPLLHYVEESLGLLQKNTSLLHFFNLNHGVYYYENNEKKLFKRLEKDVGGCYYGTYRLFKEYDSRNLWIKGNIGKSIAVQVSAKDSFNLEYNLINRDHSILSCDDPFCLRCNLFTPRKKYALLKFFTYKIWGVIYRIIKTVVNGESVKDKLLNVRMDYDINKDPVFKEVIEQIKLKYN